MITTEERKRESLPPTHLEVGERPRQWCATAWAMRASPSAQRGSARLQPGGIPPLEDDGGDPFGSGSRWLAQ